MAGMALNRGYRANSQEVSVTGSVGTANSTSPTVVAPAAAKFTVSKSATGLVNIKFNDTYPAFIGANACVGSASATVAPTVAAVGYFYTASTNTLTIMLTATATNALTNPGATETVYFEAVFQEAVVA
jgi:hypothetical protein